MIVKIADSIAKQLPAYAGDISFVKYSTPASGAKLNDKVLFLAFRPQARDPHLVIKSVRSYAAREVVMRNFNNQKRIEELLSGSAFEKIFATPLYLHDDGEDIFSIETACQGVRAPFDVTLFEKMAQTCTSFQAHIAKNSSTVRAKVDTFVEEALAASALKPQVRTELLAFRDTLPSSSAMLPRIIQHGDFTEHNVLLSRDVLSIIDCDYLGLSDIPGLDLFWLCMRFDPEHPQMWLRRYMPSYFESIGVATIDEYARLYFAYYVAERIVRKTYLFRDAESASGIIADFKSLNVLA